jgi:hypothetical protein
VADISARLGSSGVQLDGVAPLGSGAIPPPDLRAELVEILLIVGFMPVGAMIVILIAWIRAMGGVAG